MKLTAARRSALEVIAAHGDAGRARYSNETNLARGLVYWQSANWLVENGLAYYPSGSTTLALTPAGRVLLGKRAARE